MRCAICQTVSRGDVGLPPRERRRNVGFWVFMVSNALWVTWGIHAGAMALVGLQVCLAAMNIRGVVKSEA